MNKTRLAISPDLTGTEIYVRTNSFFDMKEQVRKIKAHDASGRRIAAEIVRGRESVNKDIKKLKEDGTITEKDGWYYIKDVEGSNVELPTEFVKKMNKTFHQDIIKMYLWLYRLYYWKKSQGQGCLFSYKQLIEKALGLKYGTRTLNRIKPLFYQLILNGLVVLEIKKVKTEINGKGTFLWCLKEIRTEFIATDMINEVVEKNLNGMKAFEGNTEQLDDDKLEKVLILGIDSQKDFVKSLDSADKLMVRHLARETLQPFVSVEESLRKMQQEYNHTEIKTKEDLIRWLSGKWSEGDNDKLIEYLEGL